jgi:hypothetical protein
MSDTSELAEVKAAISAVLKAQAYEFEGRKVTRADLAKLQEREALLEGKVNRSGRTGPRLAGISIRHS